jgi:tryptophan 2,3-dioxygenase
MALGPTKLGRIWVKQQSAWGTAETSFADTDAIDAQGMFMPAGAQEALGQPTQRPVFGASDKKPGSKAGATAQLTFVLTHCADGSGGVLTTIEHKLIADAFGTLQQLAAIGSISGGTADQLLVASASANWIGQGTGVLLANGNRQISWVQTVDTAPTPDEVNLPFDMEDTPGNSASATVTVAFGTGGLANLPFTMQFATAGSVDGGFRAYDGRVTNCTITANSKTQVTVAITLQFLDWDYVTGLTAPAFSFPRVQLGPVINTAGVYDSIADAYECFSEVSIVVTQTLAEALCAQSAQGVSQLVTTDRTAVITERKTTEDIYADMASQSTPGDAVERAWYLSSRGAQQGFHVAAYGPALQVQSTSKPVDLGGIWGFERVLEVRNIIASGDGTGGTSTVKGTAFRVSFA